MYMGKKAESHVGIKACRVYEELINHSPNMGKFLSAKG